LTDDNGALVPVGVARSEAMVVRPAVSPAEALEVWREYQALKDSIATPADIQVYDRGGEPRQFYKKSYWRKVGTFFNLSVEQIPGTEEIRRLPGAGAYAVTVKYRAVAPNGRSTTGDGHCGTDEDGKDTYMQVAGIAHTRAYNRAVSNLVGGGEVSAEEMHGVVDVYPTGLNAPPAAPLAQPASIHPPGGNSARIVHFGNCKGTIIRDLEDRDLDWYEKVSIEGLQDPAKAKFAVKNREFLNDIQSEKARRAQGAGAGGVPPAVALPYGASSAAPAAPPAMDDGVPFRDMAGFIEACASLKGTLGSVEYYRVLGSLGFTHSNEILSRPQMIQAWQMLFNAVLARGAQAMAQPQTDSNDIPF